MILLTPVANKKNIATTTFGFVLIFLAGLTLFWGDIPWTFVYKGALERLKGETVAWNPLLDERIPRLIVILCTGASLAVSGAVMQALFQNPLASPSILGISSGGCLLIILIYALNLHLAYPYAVPIGAVIGSFATMLIVYALSSRSGNPSIPNLLLTGIAISTLLLSIQGMILYAFRDDWRLIQTVTEWEAGSTLDRSWDHVHMQLPLTLIGLAGCLFYQKEIDLLSLGEEEALNLGVDVNKVRFRLFLSVAFLTGGALAGIGIIAFFGLVLPHLLRKLSGPMNASLIPLCIMGGSLSLLTMDLLLRIAKLNAFSIGNISAVLGGIFFLILLSKSHNE
jgi:iron complex transport system permease protein